MAGSRQRLDVSRPRLTRGDAVIGPGHRLQPATGHGRLAVVGGFVLPDSRESFIIAGSPEPTQLGARAAALTARLQMLQYDRMLLDYISAAMKTAAYEKMEDGTLCGTIRRCPGVIAFAATLYECQEELRSVLEDWLIVKLRHGDTLPVLGRVDLNRGRRPRLKTAARAY